MTSGPDRAPGVSVRLKLTLSYAAVVMVVGVVLLAAVWVYLLRYVPDRAMLLDADDSAFDGGIFPIRSNLLRVFAPRAAVAMAVLLVVGLVGGWFLAGRMLAPLDRITEATRRAATGSLAHRIEMAGRRDELRELADAFDAMLARLEAHVGEQQRFAANASHELRTPLAVTQTLLDVARSDPERDPDELVRRLHAVNARAIDLTEALLLLSRTDRGEVDREDLDLSLVVDEAVETLLPRSEEHGVAMEAEGEVAPVSGSRALLLQMATNLLHNAVVHNLASGGTVRVDTRADADGAVLVVENSGEPVGPGLVATMTEPFQRGTARVRGDHAGVGLGLAIVASIVRAHDGTLAITPRPGGGLRVTVRLPRR